MKLLIITQKVDRNDPILGFFHRWIEEFAKHCESIIVICLEKGAYQLPANVKVLSLGKPAQGWSASGREKIRQRALALLGFYKYIWQERTNYDAVFVHMNPEYVLLGGLVWKILSKKIALWYAHGHTTRLLRWTEKIVDVILTSVPEACRMTSCKIKIIGQGIDTEFFVPPPAKLRSEPLRLISVGRISPSKDYRTLIDAVWLLRERGLFVRVEILGGPGRLEQVGYFEELKTMIRERGLSTEVTFRGPVPNSRLLPYLQANDIFVSMTHTGSLDKAVLEAMATGLPVITCGEAFESMLGFCPLMLFPKNDAAALADRVLRFRELPQEEFTHLSTTAREIVLGHHSLRGFARKVFVEIAAA